MTDIKLTSGHKKTLLGIARESIKSAVTGKKTDEFYSNDAVLNTRCGAFVTLNMDGKLRGCIGNITASTPLWMTVRNMAVESALRDPRFYPLTPHELKETEIEISVLSPLEKIDDFEQITVEKHGILIKKGYYQGLLLPQVATDYKWNKTRFLEETCNKAGLNKNCYKEKGAEIFIFSAIVFGEKDPELLK
jgi:uncharacterized protein